MGIFSSKLDDNGIRQRTEAIPIKSNFITAEDRKGILEEIRLSEGFQQGGEEFRSLITEAIRKSELFIQE